MQATMAAAFAAVSAAGSAMFSRWSNGPATAISQNNAAWDKFFTPPPSMFQQFKGGMFNTGMQLYGQAKARQAQQARIA